MDIRIHALKLGIDRCYLIQGDGIVMIDGGCPKKTKSFLTAMEKLSLRPDEIELIILTHGHWDHIGSVKLIKNITGAKVALHRKEKKWLEQSLKPLPRGVSAWSRLLVGAMAMYLPWVDIPATEVDIVLEDRAFSLADYGIPGKILPTPGHSGGSVSVLLETGDAFVGDLAMNSFPLRMGPGLPIFAEDIRQVRQSWTLLLHEGAKMIYPAHGKPFSADVIRDCAAVTAT
jgi:hydroxyacylglutathione hydrolase